MAFNRANFAAISHHDNRNVRKTYEYSTADALTDVDDSGYFNELAGILTVGDRILVTGGLGGTMTCGIFLVATNNGTTVTTTKFAFTMA